jgi:predicted DNA-binding transcriptional regulator AlpA
MPKPRPSAPRAANPSPAARPTLPPLAGETRLLMSKAEVCAAVGRSYQHLWTLMRAGRFPRSRLVGTRPMWLRTEIEQWAANLPLVRLKGDAP